MISSVFDFVLLFLASFRMTRLIVFDTITAFIRAPFHSVVEEQLEDGTTMEYIQVKGVGIRKFMGELLSCYWCTGIWCSALIYGGYTLFPYVARPVIVIFAIAGCAALVEALVEKVIE